MTTTAFCAEFTLPWPPRYLSPNTRQHPLALHRAKKRYRDTCRLDVLVQKVPRPPVCALTLSLEFAPPDRRHYDQDNLIARMKAGLDGVADALQVNDNQFRLAAPRIGEPVKGGCVRVTLREVSL